MDGLFLIAGDLLQPGEDLVYGSAEPPAKVVNAAIAPVQSQQVGLHDVAHVDEVPFLLAASVDHRLLAPEHLAGEDGHHPRLAVGVLARAVDVGIAQDGVAQAVVDAVEVEVVLHEVLAGPVGVEGVDGVSLVGGEVLRLAVDGPARGGIDELLHPIFSAQFQEVEGADDVNLGVEDGLLHGFAHVRPRRLMVNDLRALGGEDLLQALGVADVEVIEPGPRIDVFALPRGEIVHHGHLVAPLDQSIHHVRADKARPSGNQNFHRRLLRFSR